MASSNTEIANLALSHLGNGKEIADLDTENSTEARAVRRFYDVAREATLSDFAWPFATKYQTLALVSQQGDAGHITDDYRYSYRYPTDCLMLRRIRSFTRDDNRQTRIEYKIAQDAQGQLILADEPVATVEFTILIDQESRYPADFVLALSLRIAAYIAPQLTKGDPFKMGDRALALYMRQIGDAQSSATNEEQPAENAESEYIRARY